MSIKIKRGVTFSHLTFIYPEVMRIIFQAQLLAPDGYGITITSGNESKKHRVNSKHYIGQAFDFRIRDFPKKAKLETWERRLQKRLGDEYFVGLEREKKHLHIQWNGVSVC